MTMMQVNDMQPHSSGLCTPQIFGHAIVGDRTRDGPAPVNTVRDTVPRARSAAPRRLPARMIQELPCEQYKQPGRGRHGCAECSWSMRDHQLRDQIVTLVDEGVIDKQSFGAPVVVRLYAFVYDSTSVCTQRVPGNIVMLSLKPPRAWPLGLLPILLFPS